MCPQLFHSHVCIKVGHICGMSKNGSWAIVDACNCYDLNILQFDLFF